MATALVAADVVALTDRLGALYRRNQDIPTSAPAVDIATTGLDDLIADVNGLGLAKNYRYGKAVLDLQTVLAQVGLDATLYATFLRALNADLGGFDAYLVAAGGLTPPLLCESFRDLAAANGIAVGPTHVFKETPQVFGNLAVTGATAGTYTPVAGLDLTRYAPVRAEVLVTTAIGATDLVVTLTMHPASGADQPRTLTLPANSAAGVIVAVGAAFEAYAHCYGVALTGGTTGAFAIRATVPRTPVL